MEKLDNDRVIKTILIVFLFLLALFLVVAIFITINKYKRSSYKLDIKYNNSNVVELNNKLPLSDGIGKSYTGKGMAKGIAEYKEITVSNKNFGKVNYEIYLTRVHNSNNKAIRSNYIKLYLTDDKNKVIKGFDKKQITSYYDLFSLSDKPGSKLLYNGSLSSGESKKFILRSWVADTYILSNHTEDFAFNIDVRLK